LIAPRKSRATDEDVPASTAQVAPSYMSAQSSDHSFTLQAIMELQKSVGEMNASLQSVKASVDGIKGKVDDLVGWKNRILGGAAVLAAVVALIGFAVGKGSDYVTWKGPPAATQAPTATPAAAPKAP
jgi:hypothetical protein